jgi:hypothetical protein
MIEERAPARGREQVCIEGFLRDCRIVQATPARQPAEAPQRKGDAGQPAAAGQPEEAAHRKGDAGQLAAGGQPAAGPQGHRAAAQATADVRIVEGLTATVQGESGRYGEVCHVTFPPTRNLDLWVAAVNQAWAEAQTQRAELVAELPDWMRPAKPRAAGELRVTVWGRLRCGKPIPPTGIRPATVLAERVAFPGLDRRVLARAEELWRRARAAR